MNRLWQGFNWLLERYLPHGLYIRALIIVIAPIVLLQTIMAGVILDRHWDGVTKVLAKSLAREVGLLTELYDRSDKSPAAVRDIENLAKRQLDLDLRIIRGESLPAPIQRPFYSLVDTKMSKYLMETTNRPFWINSQAANNKFDIRVQVEDGVIFHIITGVSRAYATNTAELLVWMVISSLILLGIAIAFLRKQIRPIVELADVAQSFGMGREVDTFRPRGATEVQLAGLAFLDMKRRITRHVEQRTAMLAGVSHDLRTILTRFKLELAFLGNNPKVIPLKQDVEEMQVMLEAYMAFVRGDGGEHTEEVNLPQLFTALAANLAREGKELALDIEEANVRVKPNAFRRLLSNVMGNAVRYAHKVAVKAVISDQTLRIIVDDDGPGIPVAQREDAFRPFVRLDHARNLDETGTGLGLAIALDIAQAHGGNISLEDSPSGGLRVAIRIPI